MRPSIIFSGLALLLMGLVVYVGMNRQPVIPNATPAPTFSGVLDAATLAETTLAETTPVGTRVYPPGREPMTLPRNFRTDFVRYAVVDRPDAVTRNIYISPDAIAAVRDGAALPERTQIVVEAFDAALDAQGNPLRDASDHLVPDTAESEIHIAELRSTWQIEDLASSAHLGEWNFGAFDATSGAPNRSLLADCFSCHSSAYPTNFIFTEALLTRYASTGETQYMYCPALARAPCTR